MRNLGYAFVLVNWNKCPPRHRCNIIGIACNDLYSSETSRCLSRSLFHSIPMGFGTYSIPMGFGTYSDVLTGDKARTRLAFHAPGRRAKPATLRCLRSQRRWNAPQGCRRAKLGARLPPTRGPRRLGSTASCQHGGRGQAVAATTADPHAERAPRNCTGRGSERGAVSPQRRCQSATQRLHQC